MKVEIEGIFDKVENAMTHFYIIMGLEKLKDIPFNTFEMSLFVEAYLKNPNKAIKEKQNSEEIYNEN